MSSATPTDPSNTPTMGPNFMEALVEAINNQYSSVSGKEISDAGMANKSMDREALNQESWNDALEQLSNEVATHSGDSGALATWQGYYNEASTESSGDYSQIDGGTQALTSTVQGDQDIISQVAGYGSAITSVWQTTNGFLGHLYK